MSIFLLTLGIVAPGGAAPVATDEVRASEIAFAKTMADRDFTAFGEFIADDAVFISAGKPLHGKAAVLAQWQQFFTETAAPFSWVPDIAEANGTGQLGTTTGPVADPDGKVFARFYSTWRREADGRWRVVFDNGYKVCP